MLSLVTPLCRKPPLADRQALKTKLNMIIRGIAGVLIGALYGALVTIVVFLLTRIGLERESTTSLIMMSPEGLAWLATVLAGVTSGITGMLLGLIVGLTGVKPRKGAIIGLIVGLVMVGFIVLNVSDTVFPRSFKDAVATLVTILIFPVGLALMALAVALVGQLLKPYDL